MTGQCLKDANRYTVLTSDLQWASQQMKIKVKLVHAAYMQIDVKMNGITLFFCTLVLFVFLSECCY